MEESYTMLIVEGVESISLLSVWMLDPRYPELLLELRRKGYITARVRPKSLGGYDVALIEPNVLAVKGSTHILYNPGRRTLIIEGTNVDEILQTFNEVEEMLKNVGSNPAKGVLFYELQVKAKASGDKWVLGRTIKIGEPLGLELSAIPISFVSANGDPNSTKWFHLDVRPIWTSWSNGRVRYEIVLIYRDDKEKLMNTLKNINQVLKEVADKATILLKTI